jgi:hypothetical protein
MDEIEAEFEIEDIRLRRRAGWRCVRTSGALSLQLHRPCGPGPISSHKLTSAPWAAPSRGRSLVLCQFHVICAESLGFHRRRSRGSLASFLGKEVAAKQTEVSCRVRRRLTDISSCWKLTAKCPACVAAHLSICHLARRAWQLKAEGSRPYPCACRCLPYSSLRNCSNT